MWGQLFAVYPIDGDWQQAAISAFQKLPSN